MPHDQAARLLDLLAAREGLVCVVGAGGKKSTLYRLAEAHLAVGTTRAALTCTVMMGPPPRALAGERLVAPSDTLAERVPRLAEAHRLVIYARPSTKPGRIAGPPLELIEELHRRGDFAVTLIKADGARMRLIKAPLEDEPLLPPAVTTVLPVVSVKALGRPLDAAIAHRLERVAAVTGAAPGERLSALHLARLLASEQGSLHRVGRACVVPIVNMVDGESERAAAREIARLALDATDRFDRLVLASMTASDPIVDVVSA